MLVKVVAAPFKALGGLFGGGEDRIELVEFEPGKAELLPPEKEKLKKVSEVLQKRPQLKLAVQGRYNPEADGLELRQRRVHHAVAARSGEALSDLEAPPPLDFSDSKTRKALEKIYEERFGSAQLDQVDQSIKDGTLKPETAQGTKTAQAETRKPDRLSKIINGLKLHRVIPGAKSPEESERLAAELYARLVEAEPVSDEDLMGLAGQRAQAVLSEMQGSLSIGTNRTGTKNSEPSADDSGLSARLFLDAM
jgi:hypothetical protein